MYPIVPDEYGTYGWLMREVGGFLELPYERAAWNHEQTGRINSIVQSGAMQFYTPPPLPMQIQENPEATEEDRQEDRRKAPYVWSFLSPLADLALTSGKSTYDMPVDFASVLGEFTLGTVGSKRVPIVTEAHLRQIIASSPRSGTPEYAALRPKQSQGSESQRWELLVYPTPETNATLSYRYNVSPRPLSNDYPWPLGGIQHAETILASCLAVAEEREGKAGGAMWGRFLEKLASSVHRDKQTARPTEDGTWDVTGRDSIPGLVGKYLGFGQNSSFWTVGQANQVRDIVKRGLQRFYLPPVLPDEKYAHNWSFLEPLHQFSTYANEYKYDLPEGLASILDKITFAPGSNHYSQPDIKIVSESLVRKNLESDYNAPGYPRLAALVPREGMGNDGVVYDLWLWPNPDAEYTLQFRYRVSQEGELIYGGPEHYQTILASCLAAADIVLNKRTTKNEQLFLERLRSSVGHDRKLGCPSTLGVSTELESGKYEPFARYASSVPSVTYKGQVW